jgi:S-formylglutathione hydrolase
LGEIPLTLRYQAGYDHSYYFMASFMASFMADDVAHHARILNA